MKKSEVSGHFKAPLPVLAAKKGEWRTSEQADKRRNVQNSAARGEDRMLQIQLGFALLCIAFLSVRKEASTIETHLTKL